MTNEEMAVKLTETESRSKSNSHRIDELEHAQKEQSELIKSVAIIAQKQNTMEGDVREIKADVKALTAKPGQRWESVIKELISAVVGGLVVYALFRLGLK